MTTGTNLDQWWFFLITAKHWDFFLIFNGNTRWSRIRILIPRAVSIFGLVLFSVHPFFKYKEKQK